MNEISLEYSFQAFVVKIGRIPTSEKVVSSRSDWSWLIPDLGVVGIKMLKVQMIRRKIKLLLKVLPLNNNNLLLTKWQKLREREC